MCLIFLAIDSHADYPIIIAANRDEFYARPTANADFWKEQPDILAGKDLQAGGTWLGFHRQGNFAAVTNFRRPDDAGYTKSRGALVTGFLTSDPHESQAFLSDLHQHKNDFAGYNLLFGNLSQEEPVIQYFANHEQFNQDKPLTLHAGIHGLSNATINTDWNKVETGKTDIASLLDKPFAAEEWFGMLRNQEKASKEQLPNTGVGQDLEHLLSSRFIQSPDYGTRCSTLLTLSKDRKVQFIERTYDNQGASVGTKFFQMNAGG